MIPLAEAEARLWEAQLRLVQEDATPDNVRRLEYWRTVVKALRAAQERTERTEEG